MPRPADNIFMQRFATETRLWRYRPWYPWQNQGSVSNARPVWALQRPPSVSNPVRKAQGRAPSPYSCDAAVYRHGYGMVEYGSMASGFFAYNGTCAVPHRGSHQADLALALRLLNDARLHALTGIGNDVTQFNAAARELGGTVRSLTQYYRHASRGVRGMFKDFPKKTQERLKHTPAYRWTDVPSDYLGYLYGIAPIAEDIENGCNQLSGAAKQGLRFGYEVKSGFAQTNPYQESIADASGQFQYFAPGSRKSYGRVGYKFNFPDWWIENVPIMAPFSTAWELTRLSFVVDWVLPVGNWIGALEAAQFAPYFKEGFETWGAIETCESDGAGIVPQPNMGSVESWAANLSRPYKAIRNSSRRTAPSGGPGYGLISQVKFPDARATLGLNHVAQAASLFTQAFHKPPSSWYRASNR